MSIVLTWPSFRADESAWASANAASKQFLICRPFILICDPPLKDCRSLLTNDLISVLSLNWASISWMNLHQIHFWASKEKSGSPTIKWALDLTAKSNLDQLLVVIKWMPLEYSRWWRKIVMRASLVKSNLLRSWINGSTSASGFWLLLHIWINEYSTKNIPNGYRLEHNG